MEDTEIAYQKSLDYLYSFVDYSLTKAFRYSPEKFNLSRMVDLMAYLGNPQSNYKIIHVAGTKGKGSCSAMIASVLIAAGYKVGFYTSPHLHDYNERIQVNNHPIPHQKLTKLVEEIKQVVPKTPEVTTFELTTAIAFKYFAQENVDVAVVEVGLGGRLDATNIVDPILSVITSLSLDHMYILGDTLAKIAFEKGGIIKEGRPVVVSPQKEEARLVIEEITQKRNSKLVQVGVDYHYAAWTHSLEKQSFLVWPSKDQPYIDAYIESGGTTDWQPVELSIPLLGYHQVENAATAYAAILAARSEGLMIEDTAIGEGFEKVFWPGRFEVLNRKPLFIIDSAHNRDSAQKLRLAIEDYLPAKPVILVFGASEDKDVSGMFAELLPRVSQFIATQSIHPRAIEPDKLVDLAHQFGVRAKTIVPVEMAIKEALEMAGSDAAVIVGGSIFIAAAARDVWQDGNLLLNN